MDMIRKPALEGLGSKMGVVGMWRYPGLNGFVSRMIEIRSFPVSESLGMFIKCRFLAVTNDLKPRRWHPGIISNRHPQMILNA